jgi:hypothetical protein
MNKYTATILLLIFGFFACKNYEEGPYFALQTKAARVANNWVVEGALDAQNNNISENLNFYQFNFERDGQASVSLLDGGTSTEFLNGTWEFVDGKDRFSWDLEGDSTLFYYNLEESFDIYRLTNSQFWLIDKDNARIFLMPL